MSDPIRISDRPWRGRCATTGLTLAEFEDLVEGSDAPDWVIRAAVGITRSYATVLTDGNYVSWPTAELVEMIETWRAGTASTPATLMAEYAAADKLDSAPQYPGEQPWVRQVAVAICDRFTIRGLCDPLYIANCIRGEEMDADDVGRRYRIAAARNTELWHR